MEKNEKIELTSSFSLGQLILMKQRLDQEILVLTFKIHQLQMQKKTVLDSKELINLNKNLPHEEDVLVPLTKTIYAPAKPVSPESFLVYIGNGFYVEKTSKEASEFYKRRSSKLTTEIEKTLRTAHIMITLRERVLDGIQYSKQKTLAIEFMNSGFRMPKPFDDDDDYEDDY